MKMRFIFATVLSLTCLSEGHCGWWKRIEQTVSKVGHDVEHAVSTVSHDVEDVGRNIGREAEHCAINTRWCLRCLSRIRACS